MFAAKRLGRELTKLRQAVPPGIELVQAEDFKEWHLDIRVLDANPIYAGQVFRLVFIFPDGYPIEPPEVTFLYVPPGSTSVAAVNPTINSASNPIDLTSETASPVGVNPSPTSHRPIPLHPHIYSNGIICLDLLGTAGWAPVQSVESVCMSIQSMLTGNTKSERPEGDADFVRSMGPRGRYGWSERKYGWGGSGKGLRDVRFAYDDDTV